MWALSTSCECWPLPIWCLPAQHAHHAAAVCGAPAAAAAAVFLALCLSRQICCSVLLQADLHDHCCRSSSWHPGHRGLGRFHSIPPQPTAGEHQAGSGYSRSAAPQRSPVQEAAASIMPCGLLLACTPAAAAGCLLNSPVLDGGLSALESALLCVCSARCRSWPSVEATTKSTLAHGEPRPCSCVQRHCW
jgi:hypothetical protein